MIFGHLAQHRVGIELLVIEHEYGSTCKPLAIELTPNSLAPASVGHGKMERTFVQIVPEHTGRQMSHGIEIVVGHHLRFSAGTAGEIHQHRIVVVVDMLWALELRCLPPFILPIVKTFGYWIALALGCFVNGHQCLHGRTLRHGGLHLLAHVFIIHADDGLNIGTGTAIHDVVLGQHVSGWNHHGTQFAKSQHA